MRNRRILRHHGHRWPKQVIQSLKSHVGLSSVWRRHSVVTPPLPASPAPPTPPLPAPRISLNHLDAWLTLNWRPTDARLTSNWHPIDVRLTPNWRPIGVRVTLNLKIGDLVRCRMKRWRLTPDDESRYWRRQWWRLCVALLFLPKLSVQNSALDWNVC